VQGLESDVEDEFWIALMNEFQSNSSGRVSYDEFKSYMVQMLERHSVTKAAVHGENTSEDEEIYSEESYVIDNSDLEDQYQQTFGNLE